ncbi:MAG: VOC family protein [Rickettsiales bacterium]|jgi:extradiol dioxygenase family protein
MEPLFHLSIPVDDLARAKDFYLNTLGCKIGRETRGRFDINFFGHHVVAHYSPKDAGQDGGTIPSDGATSPLRHFGVVLDPDAWKDMERRLTDAGVDWVLTPRVSFEGKPAEQRIMQCRDGVGNVVEFKGQPRDRVFATDAPD